jgi:hypothetical protein
MKFDKFDNWLVSFHAACDCRPVLTRHELRAAYKDGLAAVAVAQSNDELAKEYDLIEREAA